MHMTAFEEPRRCIIKEEKTHAACRTDEKPGVMVNRQQTRLRGRIPWRLWVDVLDMFFLACRSQKAIVRAVDVLSNNELPSVPTS